MRRSLLLLTLACISFLAFPGFAQASPVFVSVLGSDASGDGSALQPFASVQHAIDRAWPGDDVFVGSGEFIGNIVMRNGISLYGVDATSTVLRGSGTDSVIVADSLGPGEVISGFTITGGAASSGGGIRCLRSSPRITANLISRNSAFGGGGGVYCSSASPTIVDNIISENSGGSGAGVWCTDDSYPAVRGNSITRNHATSHGGGIAFNWGYQRGGVVEENSITANTADGGGGGVYCEYASPFIRDNRISRNSAGYLGGGAVLCGNESAPEIEGNTIEANAGDIGGGIMAERSQANVLRNVIRGNSANDGGGIGTVDGSTMLRGNELTLNTASRSGGGIFVGTYGALGAPPVVENNVVAGNNANVVGGGIRCAWGAVATVVNNTIVDNTAIAGGGVYSDDLFGLSNCILWGNGDDLSGCLASYSAIEDGDLGTGNIAVAPSFVDTGAADYHLRADSPCIDAAVPTCAPLDDKDGRARPQGGGFEMGAYEYDGLRLPPLDPALASTAHPTGVWSNDPNVIVSMSGAEARAGALAGHAVSVTRDEAVLAPEWVTISPGSPSYSFTALTDGVWFVNIRTTDSIGLWSEGTSYGPILIDTQNPRVDDDAPTSWQKGTAVVTVTAEDGLAGIDRIEWECTGASTNSGSSSGDSARIEVDAEGVTSVEYSAVDLAGNRAATSTVTARVDCTAPTISLTEVTERDYAAELQLSATDSLSGVKAMSWKVDDEPTVTVPAADYRLTYLASGTHSIAAWSVDEAGNSSSPIVHEFSVTGPSEIEMHTGSATLPSHGATFTVVGRVLSGGAVVSGIGVVLQQSADGITYEDSSVTATTTVDGTFALDVVPTIRTFYRVRVPRSSQAMGTTGCAVLAVPRALVGTPSAPSTVRTGTRFSVKGTMRPRHRAGSAAVRVYLWRWENGAWRTYGYRTATASDYGDASRYASVIRLTRPGRWRIRAYHADAGHAPSWSARYDYVRSY